MMGSRMIQVLKRAGEPEPFDRRRLRLCLWRAMRGGDAAFTHADRLSEAIGLFVGQRGCRVVSSRALLEMALRALRKTGRAAAGDALEAHSRQRQRARRQLTVVHDNGRRSRWDRHWVTQQVRHRWRIGRPAARAISAEIERHLLARGGEVSRDAVLDLVDERVENYGLAPWCLLASAPIAPDGRP